MSAIGSEQMNVDPPLAQPHRDRVVLRESIESIRRQVRDYLQDLTGPDRSLDILLQVGHELDPLLRDPAMVNP